MIEILCPRCRTPLPAEAYRTGRVAICPGCQGHVGIPNLAAAEPEPVEEISKESPLRPKTFTRLALMATAVVLVAIATLAALVWQVSSWQPAEGDSVSSVESVEKPPSPQTKLAIPDAVSLQRAREQIQQVFDQESRAADTAILKRALAAKLLRYGRDTQDDPIARYALYRAAQEMAAAAGAPELVVLAIDTMADQYQIDEVAEKRQAMVKMGESASDAAAVARLLGFLLSRSEEAARTDDYPKALWWAELAEAFAGEKEVEEQIKREIAAQQKELATVGQSRESLRTNPDDPEANYHLGSYLCLARGDWDRGLPMLAKGSEPGYQKAAKMDLAKPVKASQRKELGDAWWQLAEEAAGREKLQEGLRARARASYELALRGLSPLQGKIVEQRLYGDSAGDAALAEIPPTILRLAYELKQQLGLQMDPEGYQENVRGHREKHLRGTVPYHGSDSGELNPRYVLMPDGSFLEVLPPLDDPVLHTAPIAKLTPAYWKNPRLLLEARKP